MTSLDLNEKMPENVNMANAYSETLIENSYFITLNTKNGYLAKGSDWDKLCKALLSDVKNVVITASLTPDKFDEYEEKMMNEILSEAVSQGKNVFWVSSGEVPSLRIENGVRYITAGIVSDYKTETMKENIPACAYVLFSVKDNEIKYEFAN